MGRNEREDGSDGSSGSAVGRVGRRLPPSERLFAATMAVLLVTTSLSAAVPVAGQDDGGDGVPVAQSGYAPNDGAGTSTASTDDGAAPPCNVRLVESSAERGVVLDAASRLSAINTTNRCGAGVVELPGRVQKMRITLRSPEESGTDFDLFLTLDGRTPSPTDFDRRSSEDDTDNNETIVLTEDDIPRSGEVGLSVVAYSGEGYPQIEIEFVRTPPVARIDTRSEVRPGETFELNGSVSVLPNGSDSYQWYAEGSPIGTGETIDHQFTGTGVRTVTLEVTGSNGYTDNVTKAIEVTGSAVQPAVAKVDVLASGSPVAVGENVTFSGDRSECNDGPRVRTEWSFPSATKTGETVSHRFQSAGTHRVTMTVICEAPSGIETDSATATITAEVTDIKVSNFRQSRSVFNPWNFFVGCGPGGRIGARVVGTETVDEVKFIQAGKTIATNNSPTDGWYSFDRSKVINNNELAPIADFSEDKTITVRAISTDGTTDEVSYTIHTMNVPAFLLTGFLASRGPSYWEGAGTAGPGPAPCKAKLHIPGVINSRRFTGTEQSHDTSGFVSGFLQKVGAAGAGKLAPPDKTSKDVSYGFNLSGLIEVAYAPDKDQFGLAGQINANVTLPRQTELRGYLKAGAWWHARGQNIVPERAYIQFGLGAQTDLSNWLTQVSVPTGPVGTVVPCVPDPIELPIDLLVSTQWEGKGVIPVRQNPGGSGALSEIGYLNFQDLKMSARVSPLVGVTLRVDVSICSVLTVELYGGIRLKSNWTQVWYHGFNFSDSALTVTVVAGYTIAAGPLALSDQFSWDVATFELDLSGSSSRLAGGVAGTAAVGTGTYSVGLPGSASGPDSRGPGEVTVAQKRGDGSPAKVLFDDSETVSADLPMSPEFTGTHTHVFGG